ncbi:MAG: methionine--tRNA ligase [Bacilli bacterium]
MENKKYYITTAIAYASTKPHLGNTVDAVLADSIARYKRQRGYDVYFQTGSDEHGEKIENLAKQKNINPQIFVDEASKEIKDSWDCLNVSYDKFVRTSDKEHILKVQKIFKKLYEQGDIYKGTYEGLYCVPCESFFTESQLIEGKCPDCGREVNPTSEEAYFLKTSAYSSWLLEYIETHPTFIEPLSRKNEIINNFIKPGLQDLCVSRTSINWGIPVDFDNSHVVYVWLDALSNYITFLGYDTEKSTEKFNKFWPADLQLIGKDIIRFHTIYWPIILHILNLEQPKKIFGHPWLLFGNDKMSKSKGNIVYADDLVSKYGVDAVRYYILHEIPFSNDGNFTEELLVERINSDLANVLGNLVNRTLGMLKKYFNNEVQDKNENEEIDESLKNEITSLYTKIDLKMEEIKVSESIELIISALRRCNKYIDETEPWTLASSQPKQNRLATILYNLIESIRICAILLYPFLPSTSDEILNQINTNINTIESTKTFGLYPKNNTVNEAKILFARIEKDL